MYFSSIIERLSYKHDDLMLIEMSNLQPSESGLKPVIMISGKGGAKHGARIKVSNIAGTFHDTDNFTVTCEHEPRIIGNSKIHSKHLKDVVDWVKKNHDHLHHVWHNYGIMTREEVESGLSKL